MQQERASKRQKELLSFVDGFIKGNGYGPSYREIMRALGYKSVSTVAIHVEGLITKGYLARRDKSARSLEVVSLSPSASPSTADASSDALEDELIRRLMAAELNDDARRGAKEVFTLLGFEKAAQTLGKDTDATVDA